MNIVSSSLYNFWLLYFLLLQIKRKCWCCLENCLIIYDFRPMEPSLIRSLIMCWKIGVGCNGRDDSGWAIKQKNMQ